MTTRIKKQLLSPKELTNTTTSLQTEQQTYDDPATAAETTAIVEVTLKSSGTTTTPTDKIQNESSSISTLSAAASVTPGPGRPPGRPGRKPGKKSKALKLKAKAARNKNLKINPKSIARVFLDNDTEIEPQKIVIKNGLKRGRKPKKLKEQLPPHLEPIYSDNNPDDDGKGSKIVELKKIPKKRGRKPAIKVPPPLINIKNIKVEPVEDSVIDEQINNTLLQVQSPKIVKRKPGRQRKIKAEDTIEDVMNDLSLLIKTEDIKKEIDDTVVLNSELLHNVSPKLKRSVKKTAAGFDFLKNNLIKSKKFNATAVKVIDELDLDVRKLVKYPGTRRRHTVEKYPINSLDLSISQLSKFNQPAKSSLSPKTTPKRRLGTRRPNPYATRSDSETRSLRNGKSRKLNNLSVIDWLNVDQKKKFNSDCEGASTKLSECGSDSSFSDLVSLNDNNEKDAGDIKTAELMEESTKLEVVKSQLLMDTNNSTNQTEKDLISDTNLINRYPNNKPIDINLNSQLVNKRDTTLLDIPPPMGETPSAKVPEKIILLDIMKQTFNEIIDKNNSVLSLKLHTLGNKNTTKENENSFEEEKKISNSVNKDDQNKPKKNNNNNNNTSKNATTMDCIENKENSPQEIIQIDDDSVQNSSSEMISIRDDDQQCPNLERSTRSGDFENDSSLIMISSDNNETPPTLESYENLAISNTNSNKSINENTKLQFTEKDNSIPLNSTTENNQQEINNEIIDEDTDNHVSITRQKQLKNDQKILDVERHGENNVNNNVMDIDCNIKSNQPPKTVALTDKIICDSEIVGEENKKTENDQHLNESAEDLICKETMLKALGLRSCIQTESKQRPRYDPSLPSTSSRNDANYTGTLKTVIKINKKKGRNSFKMSVQKNKNKNSIDNDYEDDIQKEVASNLNKHGKDYSDGAHRKSHYSNRSNLDGSNTSDHVSDGETGSQSGSSHDKNVPEKSLVIPEKASSFSIHPGRLCKDECTYCFGKFGLFDTPCHIAQMKSVERQNKILAAEKHLTRDSCLCDACYRHVDRKSNTPSYVNKSLKRNALIAPGPKQNHCHVLGCNNVSTNILRRKWIIKMKKNICQAINLDLDNPGLQTIPICDQHFSALEHLMVCVMCKRRLAKNHIHYLGAEVNELNEALEYEGIPLNLADKSVVCKLCKCFATVLLKDPEARAENSANFFKEYKKRLLHFVSDIDPMEDRSQMHHNRLGDKKDSEYGRGKRRNRNSLIKNESATSTRSKKDSTEEKSSDKTTTDDEITQDRSDKSNRSRSQSSEEIDEYSEIDYHTLIPAIALEYASDSESKKDYTKKPTVQFQNRRNESSSNNSLEFLRISKSKRHDDTAKSNDLAVQKLGQNPSISLLTNSTTSDSEGNSNSWNRPPSRLISNPAISVRQLFPGEEDLPLLGNVDFNNVIERTPEGWDKCVSTIQYDKETKLLWQELKKPYGNESSFLRHLILLEKYFRNGDLVLSSTASHHAINYRESVNNRLRAYDNIPSNSSVSSNQPITMIPFNKSQKQQNNSSSAPLALNQSPITISQIGTDVKSSKTASVTLHQLSNNQSSISLNTQQTNTTTTNSKSKMAGTPPGLISLNANVRPTGLKSQPQSQKIKFPITKNWRPNLIPIDPSKINERKLGFVQVLSGGNPYHITLEDYKKMCAIKRSFEAKQKKIQEQAAKQHQYQQQHQQQQQQQSQTINSVLKPVHSSRKGFVINRTSGGMVTENKAFSLISSSNAISITTSNSNSGSSSSSGGESSETILEKLDKQVERLGRKQQQQDFPLNAAVVIEKKSSTAQQQQNTLPRIPKSLTVIPQTIRKSSTLNSGAVLCKVSKPSSTITSSSGTNSNNKS